MALHFEVMTIDIRVILKLGFRFGLEFELGRGLGYLGYLHYQSTYQNGSSSGPVLKR